MTPTQLLGPDWPIESCNGQYYHYYYRGSNAALKNHCVMQTTRRGDLYYFYRITPLKYYPDARFGGLNADELKAQLALVLLTSGATHA